MGKIEEEELLIACYDGNFEEVKRLIQIPNINVNVRDKDFPRNTPLLFACDNNHFEIIEFLLNDKRVDVNLKNGEAESSFYCACCYGKTKMVRLLLGHKKLDVNIANDAGWTPLMITCWNIRFEVLKLILASEKEVDLRPPNDDEITPIECLKERLVESKTFFESEQDYEKRKFECSQMLKLLESFEQNPNETQIQLRKELGFAGKFL